MEYFNFDIGQYEEIKGVTSDGSLPGNRKIDDYFSKNLMKISTYDQLCYDWSCEPLDKQLRIFADLGFDIEKSKEYVSDVMNSPIEMMEKMVNRVIKANIEIKQLMKNSYLKKDLILFRHQPKLFMGNNPNVGDIFTWDSYNSTSISKLGRFNYYKHIDRGKEWDIKILASAGTKGAYIAPKACKRYKDQMEFILDRKNNYQILNLNYNSKNVIVKVLI